ncbi:radical SAM protein [Sulfurimonas sp.]|uniref:radical SAM protein n=1 Tax=Sulfurimonas sp. TaxID=2022749 RepID=UPI003D0A6579
MKISLSVTHDCNLRCEYCYAGEKSSCTMDIETAKKIIDFIILITPPKEDLSIGFFGGEPLMELGLIDEIIEYIYTKNLPHPISFSITTNGTLLNSSAIDLIKKHGINISVSIDGPQDIHDKFRKDKYGNGTFNRISKNIKNLANHIEYFQVNSVFTPLTIKRLDETVRFLIDNELYRIHLNPDVSIEWGEESFDDIADGYQNIADTYIEMFNQGQEIAINLLDSKLILFFKGGYEERDKCGMGETEFGFAPSGNVYPCERLIGDDTDEQMNMGNVHTGVNLLHRCVIGRKEANENEECKECELQKYCMNWCGCTNYHMTGSASKASAMMCYSERHAIKAAKYVFESLQDNELFAQHMLNYSN